MNNSINKNLINNLLENYQIQEIERHLICFFVENNDLDTSENSFLLNYFQDFEINSSIYLSVSSLEVPTLKILENYLELLIPLSDRKLNGAFFTPSYVVDFIINEVNPKEKDKCLDPSCGGGAFLIGLVEYYKKKYNKSIKKIIQENIYGADILEYNTRRAKIILCLYGLLYGEIIEENDFTIYVQDSLKADWKTNFEVIVGNPPYVKYQDLSDENRILLIKKWKTINKGTFNLYFAFFELGYNLLTENGKLGFITPNNYFTSLSGLPLRTYFLTTKSLTRILDFSHKKVFDAQTYTAISFLNKKENEFILYDKIKENQDCSSFLNSANGSPNYIKNLNAKKWRLLKTDEQKT